MPLVAEGSFTPEQLRTLLETKSKFYDGPLEGLYIRIDEKVWLKERGKIVRADFIQEIDEHWTKKKLVKNVLSFDFE